MDIKIEYDKLETLNGKYELEFAKRIVKELNIQFNIPFKKRFDYRNKQIYPSKSYFFGLYKTKEKIGLVDCYSIIIKLNTKNRLIIEKEYDDETDYGMSAMSCENWSHNTEKVNIKLKKLLNV